MRRPGSRGALHTEARPIDTEQKPQAVGASNPAREIRYTPPIWRQWNLVWNFAQRDLKSKFKGSALGWAWSLVVPLASLGIYTLVFSAVFKSPVPALGSGRAGIAVAWIFGGLATWNFFSSSINGGIGGLIGTGALLKKIYFPAYAPVLGSTVAVGVQSLIELGLYLAILVILGNVGVTWLLLLVWLVLLSIFVASLASALAILNVYVRDLAHLVAVFLQLAFYATPIIYQLSMVPVVWHGIPVRVFIEWSPASLFVETLRMNTYLLQGGSIGYWAALVGWTAAALVLAVTVNRLRGGDLGEEL